MDIKWLDTNTIFETVVGSQAYGTNNEHSDEDIGGVCIPPKEYFLSDRINFEQANNFVDETGEKVDKTIYSLTKAVKLMAENNPNMMDYLFVPERCIKLITPAWEKVVEHRDAFLSKRCKHTYQGYAHAQLERIKTHKKYVDRPVDKPNRADFGLPPQSIFPATQNEVIAKLSRDYVDPEFAAQFRAEVISVLESDMNTVLRKYVGEDIMQIVVPEFKKSQETFLRTLASISGHYLRDEHVDMASRELAYLAAHKDWRRYETWKKTRNPKRQALEEKCGYDSKHAMHLIRLEKMAIEILDGKGLNVDRTDIDRDMLMDIRNGNWKFDDILSLSADLNAEADALYDKSKLPRSADVSLIDKITVEIIEEYLF